MRGGMELGRFMVLCGMSECSMKDLIFFLSLEANDK